MHNTTANSPTAQDLIRANIMLAALARRVCRLYNAGQSDEAKREYDAILSNYGRETKGDLDAIIREFCLWD